MDTLLEAQTSDDQLTSRYFGKYRGLVTDNQDPLSLGVKQKSRNCSVMLKQVGPCHAPYSGDGSGVYTVPLEAGVWIEFESGDVSRPIWTGCWWGSGQLPKDETGSATTPSRKIIRTEEGLLLSLDDGGKTITLSDSNGSNL